MSEFEYVNLNEIEPTAPLVPQGSYKLRLVGAEVQDGASEKGPWRRYKVQVQVLDHPTQAGRRVYDSFFQSPSKLRYLRKLMDATGIAQPAGVDVVEWFSGLPAQNPEFNAVIKEDSYMKDGVPKPKNALDFASISPAE